MKTIIIYATKHGCTEDVARQLVNKLADGTIAVNVEAEQDISLQGVDQVVFGSCVYMGQIHKAIKKYIKKNSKALFEKHNSIFLCKGSKQDSIDDVLSQNLPEIYPLFEHKVSVGGEFRTADLHFWEKKIIQMVSKKNQAEEPVIDETSIATFAKQLKL